MAKAKQPEQKKEKFVPPQEWFDAMAREEKRAGLPAGMLRSIYEIEGRSLTAADQYHYPFYKDTGKRLTPQSGYKQTSDARGLFGVMGGTAKAPGYNVRPLQDWSLDEQARFAADYYSALLRDSGGNPYKALRRYGGNSAYPNQIMGRLRYHNKEYIAQLDKKGVTPEGVTPEGGTMPVPKAAGADTKAAPTNTRGGLSAAPRQYPTNGPSRMPNQDGIAFQTGQPPKSDLQQGLQSFREREAAGPATSLYGSQPQAPNAPLPAQGELNTAMRNFEVAAEPTFPARGVGPQTFETFAPRSTYAEQNPSQDVFNRYSVQQPMPREDIYAGIEGGMEGNPSWPGSGPLTRTASSSYIEQNPSRDVFSRYAVEQPSPTYEPGNYTPIQSARMFNGRMVEQPAPQAMEPFTPRSTYAEQNPSRDVFSRYAVQQPEPRAMEQFVPRSTYVEQSPSRDVFSRYSVQQPEPQAMEQFVPRSTYAERNPAQDVFSRYAVQQPAPGRVSMSFPPPPAEPYDSGNYTPIPSPRMYNGRMVEQPAPQRGYDTNGPSRFSQMPGAPAAPEQSAMRSASEQFPRYYSTEGQSRFSPTENRPDTAFMDWYDRLVSTGVIQPAQQGLSREEPSQYSDEPYPDDWQDQLNRYYMENYGTRYQPEMAPIRTSAPEPTYYESASEPEPFVPLRQQDVTPPPYYTSEPVVDVPQAPEVPAGWSSRLKLYGR